MKLNKKTDFVIPERLSLNPLKRLIAIFMIAMLAIACSRSDRHVSLPTNNPNKPGFQDGGNGIIIPGVDFTFNGNVN